MRIHDPGRDGSHPVRTPRFTPRERELAGLVARGLDNAQIAAHLRVADKTLRNALSSRYTKVGVDSRARATLEVAAHIERFFSARGI